jgi:hypothetical protein
MGTTQLNVYNEVLTLFGERILATLTDQREPRRVIDAVYSLITGRCLSMGNWKFAIRTATLSSVGAGQFGYTYQMAIPSDLLHLFAISANAAFNPPMFYEFGDFAGFYNVNTNPVYVAYLSNDPTAGGMNLANWTPLFENFVVASIANYIKNRIPAKPVIDLQAFEEMYYMMALAHDSIDLVSGMLPFNAAARDDVATSSPIRANAIMPFGKWLQMRELPAPQQGRGAG